LPRAPIIAVPIACQEHPLSREVEASLARLEDLGCTRCLRNGLHGIEKESLRIAADGRLAGSPHPVALGSALTHSAVTTDYSEALLEFVTPPFHDVRETLADLAELHAWVAREIAPAGELLWATSMPCGLDGDESIPIAWYGDSNRGFMRHVYRRGLGHRYGRIMQVIAGVHYNFSLPRSFWDLLYRAEGGDSDRRTFIDQRYFGLIRNFQRMGWLVPYLFGASPAVCPSFLDGRDHDFEALDGHTLHAPFATSLRMSDIGYKNKNQAGLDICYNSLASYTDGLERATRQPDPDYQRIGTVVDGDWRQLNTNLLQIENEYYSFIRPKQPIQPGERPVHALRERGVAYIEIRALDVNAWHPLGVSEADLRFMEAFLIYCLLRNGPPMCGEELEEMDDNQRRVAVRGRDPALRLRHAGGERPLKEWAGEILDDIRPIAGLLDDNHGRQSLYRAALEAQAEKLRDTSLTPSARMLAEMRARGESFPELAMRLSQEHMQTHLSHPLSDKRLEAFRAGAAASLRQQQEIEATDETGFEEFVANYFAQG
jgi:glutamate--cysteine ligase